MMRSLILAVAAGATATVSSAQSFHWVNYESEKALEETAYASSAARGAGIGSYRVAADDFELTEETTLTKVTFYSVSISPTVIIGGDWYIYEFDEATQAPGALIAGAFDVKMEHTDSGLTNPAFGTIFRNAMEIEVTLEAGKYFLGFRTHTAPVDPADPGKPTNPPLHPAWTSGAATGHWNFSVLESGAPFGPWQPMTDFTLTPCEWAFELEGDSVGGCYADCDGSGELDFFDFLCFQNLFGAGDPAADCDGSGGLDFFDFLCFQNEFAAGCP